MKKTSKRLKKSSISFFDRLFVAPKQKRRRSILRPCGKVYDLEEIQKGVCSKYFDPPFFLPITWFGSGVIPKTRLLFGSYCCRSGLIKVNRVLDSEEVPLFFVHYIVYHEMLHHLYPPKKGKGGRWKIHHPEFKMRESAFEDYNGAQLFLKEWKALHFKG